MDQGDVRHVGKRPFQRVIDLLLARGVDQMIVATDDMGHAHVVIVDDDRKHIGRGAVAAQHAELGELVDGCMHNDWERPTRCVGWDVASVLLHLAQTDEFATASVRGELEPLAYGLMGRREDQKVSVDDAAAAQVETDRAAGGPAIRQRWHDASRALCAALQTADPHARATWVTNRLSVQTLATTRLAECWIHTGDIASALGKVLEPTDRLQYIARLAWRTLPYAFERADMTTRLLGARYADAFGRTGWTTTLRSCSAHEAYLRAYRHAVDAASAVEFLLLDRLFPRSVYHALTTAEQALGELDPRSARAGVDDEASRRLGRLRAELEFLHLDEAMDDLPRLLERIQRDCAGVHGAIARRYFRETRVIEWSV